MNLRLALGLGVVLSAGLPCLAQRPGRQDLTEASLEDLMNIQVTSVSRKEQKLGNAGAAVYVINQDDIRHSGMMNIPDLLRMVPGVNVARIDANAWAISIRGFNYRYSTKVLVLIDGRSVYTPQFSGVYWDQQDVPLEDIERIEVIRGPGGTVWGANAVNGVINIITKSSKETEGGLISVGTGSEESAEGLSQYGGKIGAKGHYRVFGRYFRIESSAAADRGDAADGWHGSHGGFRTDWDLSQQDKVTLQGDLFGTSEGQTVTTLFSNRFPDLYTFDDKVRLATGNLLGRWSHTFSNGSETSVQLYYDRLRRFDQALNIQHTGDFDFQYHFHAGSRNDIVTGMGYRLTDLNFTDGYGIAFGSGHRRDNLLNTFVQDQISLTNSLTLTVGSKFEHNAFTGFEYEPSAQLVWAPTDRQSVWGSISRAIQQPSWFYAEARLDAATFPLDGGGFGLVQVQGNPNTKAEELRDVEVGYRSQVSRWLTLDATVFVSNYYRLTTEEPHAAYFSLTPPPPHLVTPVIADNLARARNYGTEFFANWQVTKRWRISPGFSFLQMNITRDPSSNDASIEAYAPKHEAQLRSAVNLPHNLEWDAAAYYVGRLGYGPVASYTGVDTRLGWRPGDSVELSVAGQNLLAPRRFEFLNGVQVNPTQVERSIVGKITWRF